MRENLTLDQLSNKACMSKAQFSRSFKKVLGTSPMEYILDQRLNLAANYLKQGNSQVQEVCFMPGFNNVTYLIRAFKSRFGKTPKAFQKKLAFTPQFTCL
ncbi:helix-turn-helix domain-containing protein [Cyclobacterium jeungdonense]|uniref:Helix-turn-helix transcriptional regulator n=1 Tax=Cyclobacterium jeungdonense TaxID=708087 RepID=A0ABT8C1I6_9BACT|nr:helix-turn-helix transcriptional regulator [Cyclobacterium jeungdonense]MDN3686345.1 helix-turn-helix transcriptional regulator [Cyclobacterium jeungdonense]